MATEAGMTDRSNRMFEAFPTTWGTEALPSVVLLARVLPWSRKKRPFDAPQVGLSATTVGPGQSYRKAGFARAGLASEGQEIRSPQHTDFSDDERSDELSKGYRSDLQQHDDATYVNVGTMRGSPNGEWASLRLLPCMGRSPRSSPSRRKSGTWRRRAVGFQVAIYELRRRTDV